MKKIIVVGGGAAGMMAAIAASDNGNEVCLIEKNEKLGKKLFITGKGRCNVTNAGDMDALFSNVMSNAKFLYSAFHDFHNKDVMRFLEEAGCRLKVERGDRVFPVSDHSSDVIGVLDKELKKRNVKILLNTKVQEIVTEEKLSVEEKLSMEEEISGGSRVRLVTGVRLADGRRLQAHCVVIATGGLSYASTGSDGDGYAFGEAAGHKIIDCRPSLVPLMVREEWCKELMGLALKNVSIRLCCGKKELYQGFGEMLFTHYGVSGPLILSASSYYVQMEEKHSKAKGEAVLYIDLKPALSSEQLDRRILREFEENKKKQFRNALNTLFPVRLIPIMIRLSGIQPEKKVYEITREERKAFVDIIKRVPLTITGTGGYQEAVITKGGVSVKEVNPSTMESRKVSGMFFAGEVLDLDALTGGFNLQIAWSTGHLAGKSADGK